MQTARAEGGGGDSRGDEVVPALLARLALHPVLVELGDLGVVVLRELGELLHRVLEDLVVNPARAPRRK